MNESLLERTSGQENTMLGYWARCKHFCFLFVCSPLSMLQVLYPYVSKVERVFHLCIRFSIGSPSPRCLFFLLVVAGHLLRPLPLLDAGIATHCSHLLQFAGCVHALEKQRGCERGLPTCFQALALPSERGKSELVNSKWRSNGLFHFYRKHNNF